MVDYSLQLAELNKQGIYPTEEEQNRIRQICEEEYGKYKPGKIIGTSFLTSLVSGIELFLKLFKNIWQGKKTENIGDYFSHAIDKASDETKQSDLDKATMRVYVRLQAAGGNCALAAPFITGQVPSDQGVAVNMQNSFRQQWRAEIQSETSTPITHDNVALNSDPVTPGNAPVGNPSLTQGRDLS